MLYPSMPVSLLSYMLCLTDLMFAPASYFKKNMSSVSIYSSNIIIDNRKEEYFPNFWTFHFRESTDFSKNSFTSECLYVHVCPCTVCVCAHACVFKMTAEFSHPSKNEWKEKWKFKWELLHHDKTNLHGRPRSTAFLMCVCVCVFSAPSCRNMMHCIWNLLWRCLGDARHAGRPPLRTQHTHTSSGNERATGSMPGQSTHTATPTH